MLSDSDVHSASDDEEMWHLINHFPEIPLLFASPREQNKGFQDPFVLNGTTGEGQVTDLWRKLSQQEYGRQRVH